MGDTVIPLTFGGYYMITVHGIELKAKYIGNDYFQTIEDKYHISQISSIRKA